MNKIKAKVVKDLKIENIKNKINKKNKNIKSIEVNRNLILNNKIINFCKDKQ
jgi:hypothetical protein